MTLDGASMTPVVRGRLHLLLLALVAVAGCTDIQLGAANLIETVAVPRTEVAYGDGPRQRMDVYRALYPHRYMADCI